MQLISHHLSPYEPEGAKYYSPWLFSARGPLAGMAATPIVLATGARPPLTMPDQPWTPFDTHGFAAYRIALVTLGSLALVAVAALLQRLGGDRQAWLGVVLVALSPFLWHEMYFTWPKLIAASFVLGAFHALLARRYAQAGLWLGAAYLWHPLALLSAPFCGLWALFASGSAWWRIRSAAALCIAVVSIVATWQALNAGHSGQTGFLHYFVTADGVYRAGAELWWQSRWNNAANTLIPLYVFLVNSAHPAFNALSEPTSACVRFFLQYWTAAPFATGVVTSAVLAPALIHTICRHPRITAITLIGPLLLFVLYWGASSTGIMREGGHVLFLTQWILVVWAAADQVPSWVASTGFGLARGTEVLAMMLVPAWIDGVSDANWWANDLFWLLILAASVGAVVYLTKRPPSATAELGLSPARTSA